MKGCGLKLAALFFIINFCVISHPSVSYADTPTSATPLCHSVTSPLTGATRISRGGEAIQERYIELQIPCELNAQVKAILPNNEVVELGQVLSLPIKTNWPAYTASKWCDDATVCASAVNAVHLLINKEKGRGRIISLVPSVTLAPAAKQGAFFALGMQAGTGVFGGFAPLVGSKVYIKDVNNNLRELDGVLKQGETLIIRSKLPDELEYYMIDIENRPGGRIIAYGKNNIKVVARVIRPVKGVGRFGGSQFQINGRIRASHAGVICVTTSKRGEVGGFQIMPLIHALTSNEMINAWQLTQWMIIAPARPEQGTLAGHSPLFKNSFLPGTAHGEKLEDTISTYGRKPLVLCRLNNSDWVKLPKASGKSDDALKDVTHIRIYFPFYNL